MKLDRLPQAFGLNIIVKVDKSDNTTDGGIILTANPSRFRTGTVMSVAELVCEDLNESDEDFEKYAIVACGERLMFVEPYAQSFECQGETYNVIQHRDVIAKL